AEIDALVKDKIRREQSVRALQKKIEELSSQLARAQQIGLHRETSVSQLCAKDQDIAVCEKWIADHPSLYDAGAHGESEKLRDKAEKDHAAYLRVSERVLRIPLLEKEISALKENEKASRDEAAAQEKLRGSCGYSKESHADSEAKRKNILLEKDAAQKEKDILSVQILEKEKESLRIGSDISRYDEQKQRCTLLTAEKDTLARLVSLCDGFKNALLSKVQPSLSAYASDLFSRMTNGRYERIIVDDSFDFHIADRGQTFPLGRFSGGETDLANLCLRIAVSRTIQDLAGGGAVSFLGFDEIFGSQDAERRSCVMDALNRLSDQYSQIFIVSHVE
ncbi:MAG: hypothetical protein ACRCUT_03310, partial [Spirochaetota bacterium]